MPTFEYECPIDGSFTTPIRADFSRCPKCGFAARRKWSFTIVPSFSPHFNPSTNSIVRSPTDFRDQLSRKNEDNQARGIPSDLVPVDLRDKAALGVTNDGLDATYDRYMQQGRVDDAQRLKKLMDE